MVNRSRRFLILLNTTFCSSDFTYHRGQHQSQEQTQQRSIMKNTITQPQPFYIPLNRRRFMRAIAVASAGFTLKGYLAEALTIAPEVTQGPYYPLANNIPLDKDNDLIYLNNNLTRAIGKITYLTGRVLTSSGSPISGA